jgi:hypothetical protein
MRAENGMSGHYHIPKEKNGGDEPLVIMHINMEMSQGKSLNNYLKQTKLSFFFSFTKLENRRVEKALSGGVGTSGRGENVGKGVGG